MSTAETTNFYPWLDGFCHTVHHGSREAWKAHRLTGIGGTAAVQILTGDRWKLWDELTGGKEPDNLDHVEHVQWGSKLEGLLVDELGLRTKRHVVRWNQTDSLVSDLCDWQRCTPDAFQIDDELGPGLVSAKCTREWLASDWEDGPPLEHQIQLQHEMGVTGMTWGSICVLIGGNRFAWFDCERNNRFISAMHQKETEFWRSVEDRVPPPVDGSEGCRDVLRRLYPKDQGETVSLTADASAWAERLTVARQQEKEAKKEQDLCKNHLASEFGTATFGITPDGTRWSFKQQTKESCVVKESTFRVLRKLKG